MPIKTKCLEAPYSNDGGEERKECQTWNEVEEYAKEILNQGQSLLAWDNKQIRKWVCIFKHEITEVEV